MFTAFLVHELPKPLAHHASVAIRPFIPAATSAVIPRCRSFTSCPSRQLSSFEGNGISGNPFNSLVRVDPLKIRRHQWVTKARSAAAAKRVTWIQPMMSYNRLPLLVRQDIEVIGTAYSKQRLAELVDCYDDYEVEQEYKRLPSIAEDDSRMPESLLDWSIHRARIACVQAMDESKQELLINVYKAIDTTYLALNEESITDKSSDAEETVDQLFELYDSLPAERYLCLDPGHRQRLLEITKRMPTRTERTMLRFLSIIKDMSIAGIPVEQSFHNHAIHLVGRTLGTVTYTEVNSALSQWTMTELGFGTDVTTFNILLDIAVKGQQFAVAEMILAEMQQQGFKMDRFTRVGIIYYHGVRGDGAGIRKAYRELVEKDMIVDTTVLNCVIASLLRAGEVAAAEQLYSRMKEVAGTNDRSSQRASRNSKESAKALKNIIRHAKVKDIELVAQLQREQDLSPDANTFNVLISHHVSETGDFPKIAQYLKDSLDLGMNPDGRMFLHLFRGFFRYGNMFDTSWKRRRLDEIWTAFRSLANKKEVENVYWDKWAVLWILRAYVVCYDHRIALNVWSIAKSDWKKAGEHEELMMGVIDVARSRSRSRWGGYYEVNSSSE